LPGSSGGVWKTRTLPVPSIGFPLANSLPSGGIVTTIKAAFGGTL
jgi:hypothetical protein